MHAKHSNRPVRIQIKLINREHGKAEVIVSDNGNGISPKDQDFIFERFYRSSNPMNSHRGLGLGLTFSRLLAIAMGGDLVLHATSDIGSSFALLLPIHNDSSNTIQSFPLQQELLQLE
ncbi:Sensor protein TorS [compost metagenome]